jgi:hypothetical protein
LRGCLPTEHERPEVVRRLGLALNSPGAVGDAQLLAFADLQILSRHIVPFTPVRVKDSVLSESFRELHGLNKSTVHASGWSGESYLELISSPNARQWWAGCIGTPAPHAVAAPSVGARDTCASCLCRRA